ncbi:MAG: NADH-quinone oxidoreductase subunit C [Candidatus Margulisiibacteriota bacterium]
MNIVEQIKEKFGDKIKVFERSSKRTYIDVPKEEAKDLARYIFKDLKARFSIATGTDTRPGIEILYHFALDKHNLFVTLRVLVKKPELTMETFSDIIPATNWIEREIHEMLGVNFLGHPNLTRLLLPDDWKEGEYPFRKKTFESEKEYLENK